MLSKIFTYAWRWVVNPPDAASDQLYEERNSLIGFWVVFIAGLLYAGASFLLRFTGFIPGIKPILPVDAGSYYFWQGLFAMPWLLATWLATALLVHVWNYAFNRERRLRDILGPMAYVLAVPWFVFTFVPVVVSAPIFGALSLTPWSGLGFPPWPAWIEVIRLTLAGIWMSVLSFIAVRKVYAASWILSLFSAILTVAVFAVMFYVFMR